VGIHGANNLALFNRFHGDRYSPVSSRVYTLRRGGDDVRQKSREASSTGSLTLF